MKKNSLFLLVFMVIKMVVQYAVADPVYELHRDEFLHLDQAKHLAWGFQSVPPFTAMISWIISILGNSVFWVRFFPALFGALTIAVVWKAVAQLKGNLFACILSATALLFSPYLRINLLFQPNSFDILCWTLVYYGLIRFVQENHFKWLYFSAICFAIGFLNKYNIAFCIIGLLPAILLSAQRKYLISPQFYLAILLALVLIAPNLIWQYSQGFPVFEHMKELRETQLVHVGRMDFISDQFKFFIGSLFILIAAFIGFIIYRPFRPYRLLFWSYLFTMFIFILLRAKGYYALGLYPILIAFGAVYLGHLTTNKRYLQYSSIGLILILFIPVPMIALPLKTPDEYFKDAQQRKPFSENRWEDGRVHPISQDFADMLGWTELARKVDSVYAIYKHQRPFIFCDNYGQAGAINYYTHEKDLKANSLNADYATWMDLSQPIKMVIYVAEKDHDLARLNTLFATVSPLATLNNPYARENGTQILLLSRPKKDFNDVLRLEIAERR